MSLLEGVRIVDLSELAPGPFCTMLLSDLGAEVIKVERPTGDPVRNMISGVYEVINRNKKSIALNLKNEEARKLVFKLAERADVFVESYRPGVANRLGVGYEQIKSANERIIYCSISGYGQDGPYRDWPGHDVNYCAVAGISSVSGEPDGPPAIGAGVPVADFTSSLYACISIIAKLYSHEGGYLDVSMADCALNFMLTRINEVIAQGKSVKEKFTGRGAYGIFKAKDDKYVAIAPIEAHFWQRFCKVIGHEGLEKDSRFETWAKRNENREELNAVLDRVFLTRSQEEWISVLIKTDVPCSPVNYIDELKDDPHIKSRKQIVESEKDGLEILHVLFPTCFDGKRLPIRSESTSVQGENTEQILTDIGLTESEIEGLKEKGAFG